jgi:hypothetical protein
VSWNCTAPHRHCPLMRSWGFMLGDAQQYPNRV